MEGLAQAKENGSDHLEATHLLNELVRDVACGQVGENQGVDLSAPEVAERKQFLGQLPVERHVGLHFPIDNQVGMFIVKDAHSLPHLLRVMAVGRPEIAVAQHGDAGDNAHGADRFRRQEGDVHQLPGGRVSVYRGVRKEHRTALGLHDVHARHLLDTLGQAKNLKGRQQTLPVVARQATDDGIGLADLHQHGSEVAPAPHVAQCLGTGQPLALAFGEQVVGKFFQPPCLLRRHGIQDFHVRQFDAVLLNQSEDALAVAEQNGLHNPFVPGRLHGLEDLIMIGLCEDNALGVTARPTAEVADEGVVLTESAGQNPLVVVPIADGLPGHTALHGSQRHSRGDRGDEPRIHRLGDDEIHAESQTALVIGFVDLIGHILLGERGDGANRRHLHGVVDRCGPNVHGPPEDEGEAQDVVDLIRMVAAAGGHDDIRPRVLGFGVRNLRIGIGEGKDDGLLRHAADHVAVDESTPAQAEEHVGPLKGVGEIGERLLGMRQSLLARPEALPSRMDVALAVEHRDVLQPNPELHVEVEAGHGRRASTTDHEPHVFGLLPGEFQCVDQGRTTDDGGAMLVIVHDRDVEFFLEATLDFKSFWGLDVLEVDAPEGGCNGLHRLDEGVHVGSIHFDVKAVEVSKDLEQDPLALHHRLAGIGTDVPQSQHGGAIADHRDEVALGRVLVDVFGVLGNLQAGFGHARGVRQAQVALGAVRLGRDDLHLAPTTPAVVVERFFPANAAHRLRIAARRWWAQAAPPTRGQGDRLSGRR